MGSLRDLLKYARRCRDVEDPDFWVYLTNLIRIELSRVLDREVRVKYYDENNCNGWRCVRYSEDKKNNPDISVVRDEIKGILDKKDIDFVRVDVFSGRGYRKRHFIDIH